MSSNTADALVSRARRISSLRSEIHRHLVLAECESSNFASHVKTVDQTSKVSREKIELRFDIARFCERDPRYFEYTEYCGGGRPRQFTVQGTLGSFNSLQRILDEYENSSQYAKVTYT